MPRDCYDCPLPAKKPKAKAKPKKAASKTDSYYYSDDCSCSDCLSYSSPDSCSCSDCDERPLRPKSKKKSKSSSACSGRVSCSDSSDCCAPRRRPRLTTAKKTSVSTKTKKK